MRLLVVMGLAWSAVALLVRSVLGMANTNFGALQISDGYTSPQQINPFAPELIGFFAAGAQVVGNKKNGAIVGIAGTVVDVRCYLDTAPTGASFIVDILKNGTTIYTTPANRPTILAGANASSLALPDVTSVAAGDRLTYNVAQIGAGTAGSDLYVSVTIKQALQI